MLLAELEVPEVDSPPRVDVHHILLVGRRDDLEVLGHREGVVELARRPGVAMLYV